MTAARRIIFGAAVALLSGCAAPEPLGDLPFESAPALSSSGMAALPDRWWTSFDDDDLDERIDRALAENFTLAAAWERIDEARAFARRAQADLRPRVNGTAFGEVRDGSDVVERTEVRLGLEASYEVDLWGRIESAVEAERLRAAATEADYRTAAITLSAEVALTWYRLVEARLQLALVHSQVETNAKVLDVLEKRFAVGQSGSADVLRQRQLVEATREQAIIVQARIDVLEHLLAVLEGRAPQGMASPPTAGLPPVPPPPATGLPADLLQRRPDVRSALRLLEASDEDLAAAVADQYPRIDLAGAITTSDPSGLFSSWLAALAGQLVAPLYDGGERRAEVERNVAIRRRRLAEYGQIVLDAFREVEDSIALEAQQVRRIGSLDRQLTLARSTSQQLRSQYMNGAADYIDVLAALREEQRLERDVLAAQLEQLTFRIGLYRALAGGFETPRDASEVNPNRDGGEDESGGDARG